MATASALANYVVRFFQKAGDPLTNLKLQKLLYYVQGWHLGLHNEPAFDDELEAWVHGPVAPEVYRQYRSNKWNPITQPMPILVMPKALRVHIDSVLEVYGVDSAYELERRTHQEAPWLIARRGIPNDQDSHAVITKKSMTDFFSRLARE